MKIHRQQIDNHIDIYISMSGSVGLRRIGDVLEMNLHRIVSVQSI
jgi:hypothetical protein